jgi:hypothetical protein
VDSVWEQRKLETTLREMLDAKRAARAKRRPTSPVYVLLGNL